MFKRIYISLLLLVILSGTALSQRYSSFSNYQIFPSAITQTEPVICISPLNHQILFVSAVTIKLGTSLLRSEGVYFSTNGGTNWIGIDSCTGQSTSNHGGSPGVAINNNGVFVLTHNGLFIPGAYGHFSTDFGTTWSNASTIIGSQTDDKCVSPTTADYDPASSYFGRIYHARVVFTSPFPVDFSYSTNGGTSWVPSFAINNSPPLRCSGAYVKTGIDGKVYACWAGVNSISPFPENLIGLAVSTNGGDNWSVNQNIYAVNGINGTLPSKGSIRVNGLPNLGIDKSNGPRRGWLYIATTEQNLAPAGSDPDIILHYSSNNGTNWSPGIRVNKDPVNNGKIQYFPSIDVDSTGAVNILYYDDRNTSSDSAEVYLSRSKDGGSTWTEFLVSSHRFKPKPIPGGAAGYQGDHITLQSSGNKLYAMWMDDYSGLYQVWLAPIDISTIGIRNITTEIPDKFNLQQNYPNPFNPSTKIKFDLPLRRGVGGMIVSLKIYNITGREISTLVNENLQAGSYEVTFDGANMPSGVYFYRLTTDNYSQSKKMTLIK
jgi:hypothetical protein